MDGCLICHREGAKGCRFLVTVRGSSVRGSRFQGPGSRFQVSRTGGRNEELGTLEPGTRNVELLALTRVTPHRLASSGLGKRQRRPAGWEPRDGRTVFSTSRTLVPGRSHELLLCTLPALHLPECRVRKRHPTKGFETTPGEVR